MEDENKIETAEEANLKARRKFLKTAAGVAVTAPAVTMLLAASTKSQAGTSYIECMRGFHLERGQCVPDLIDGPRPDTDN